MLFSDVLSWNVDSFHSAKLHEWIFVVCSFRVLVKSDVLSGYHLWDKLLNFSFVSSIVHSYACVGQDVFQFSLHRFLIHFNCIFPLKVNRIIDHRSRARFERIPQHIVYSFKKYAQFVHSLGVQLPLFSMIQFTRGLHNEEMRVRRLIISEWLWNERRFSVNTFEIVCVRLNSVVCVECELNIQSILWITLNWIFSSSFWVTWVESEALQGTGKRTFWC